MIFDIHYRIYEASVFVVDCIFEILKPTLVIILFMIIGVLSTFLSPLYIFYIFIYNVIIYIKGWYERRRYRRIRAENDELLHDLLEERHLISVIREYADE